MSRRLVELRTLIETQLPGQKMFRCIQTLIFALALLLGGLLHVQHSQAQEKVTFDDDIKTILRARCATCHNGNKKSGGLDLTNMTNLMQGGSSGAVIEPGDSAESYLYQLVNHDEEPIMPPESDKIPAKEIELIAKWIDGGALENKKSVSTAPKKPKLDMIANTSATTRPEIVTGPPRMSLEPVVESAKSTAVNSIAVSPWAPIAAISSTRQILLFNTKSNQLVGVIPFPEGQANVLKFSRNGSLLLAGGGRSGANGKVVVWDVRTGRRIVEVGDELETVLAADISNDHSMIALGGPQKMLRVYHTSTGELAYEIKKHTDWVTSIEFSPDGVLLASGDRNGGLFVWESETGNEYLTLKGHTNRISSISWRIDSNVVASASEDVSIRLWEMENGSMVKNWGAHGGGVSDMQFTRDGNIVSCGRDRVTKLWNQNGGQIRAFTAFADIAVSCAFCNESKSLISSDWTGEVRVFNSADGKLSANWAMNPPTLANRLAAATANHAQLAQKIPPLKTVFDAANQQLTDIKAKLAAQQTLLNDTQTKINQTTAQLTNQAQQLKQLQTQLQGYQKPLTSNQQAKPLVLVSLEKAKLALAKLPSDPELTKSVNELTAKSAAIDAQIKDLSQKIAAVNKQVGDNKAKTTSLQSESQTLKTKLTATTNAINAINKQMPPIQKQFDDANQNLNVASQQVAVAEKQTQYWTAEIAFAKQLAELQQKRAAAQEQVDKSQQVVAERQFEHDQAKKQLDETNAKLAAQQASMVDTQNKITANTAQTSAIGKQLAEYQTQVQGHQKLLGANQQAKPFVQESLTKAKEALAKLVGDPALTKTVNDLTAKTAAIDAIIKDLNGKIASVNKQIADNQTKTTALQAEAKRLGDVKVAITNEMAAISKQVPNLQKLFAEKQTALNAAKTAATQPQQAFDQIDQQVRTAQGIK